MQKHLIRNLVFLLFSIINIFSAFGDSRKDFYIRQSIDRYFELNQDAMSLSLGGSSALQCQNSSCIYLNPAGLGFEKDINITLSGGTIRRDGDDFVSDEPIEQFQDDGYLTLALPIGATDTDSHFGTAALGYSRYQGDTDDSINTRPDGHRRSIGYGIALNNTYALGYAFTFYDDQLQSDLADLHSHARLLHSFGAQAKLAEGLTFGALFKLGIGQSDTEDFQFESDGLSHLRQYSISVGLSKQWNLLRSFFAIDYTHYDSDGNLDEVSSPVVIGSDEEGNVWNIRIGAETQIIENLFLRAGFRCETGRYDFDRSDLKQLSGNLNETGFSSGIGYAFFMSSNASSKAHLDYGVEYLDTSRGNIQHLLTFSVPIEL